MKRESKRLVLKKQTLQTLTGNQLDRARGGYFIDSHITCDLACLYWSVFTR